jgi:hypothetical protein
MGLAAAFAISCTWFCRPLSSLCKFWFAVQVGMLEGRMTRQLVVSLLNHIRAFSDWAQCFVLDLVAQYQPASEEERFDILEVGCTCQQADLVQ